MAKKPRLSLEEKLAIISEVEINGLQVTLRKYGIYPSTYYSWRKKYEASGEIGLDIHARYRKECQLTRQLEDEVSLLKQLLAEKEMEIALQSELLKKKYPLARKKR